MRSCERDAPDTGSGPNNERGPHCAGLPKNFVLKSACYGPLAMKRTYEEEKRFITRETDTSYRIETGFVNNMKVARARLSWEEL